MDATACVELRVAQRFDAPPERVFDAWLNPADAGAWLFATASRPLARVEMNPRVGGSFRLLDRRGPHGTEYAGEYLEIVPPRRLAFRLAVGNGAACRVTVEVVPVGAGCELRLAHEDVPERFAGSIEGRWIGMLYGLAARLRARAAQEAAATHAARPAAPGRAGAAESLSSAAARKGLF